MIWLWIKNTGYLKKTGLLKGKINPSTCGEPRLGWHLFDPSRHIWSTGSHHRLSQKALEGASRLRVASSMPLACSRVLVCFSHQKPLCRRFKLKSYLRKYDPFQLLEIYMKIYITLIFARILCHIIENLYHPSRNQNPSP